MMHRDREDHKGNLENQEKEGLRVQLDLLEHRYLFSPSYWSITLNAVKILLVI